MKTDNTRHKTQKWYASEQEEDELLSHCQNNGLSKSEFVRRLVMHAIRPRTKIKRISSRREGPRLGPVIDFTVRRGGAPIPLRL